MSTKDIGTSSDPKKSGNDYKNIDSDSSKNNADKVKLPSIPSTEQGSNDQQSIGSLLDTAKSVARDANRPQMTDDQIEDLYDMPPMISSVARNMQNPDFAVPSSMPTIDDEIDDELDARRRAANSQSRESIISRHYGPTSVADVTDTNSVVRPTEAANNLEDNIEVEAEPAVKEEFDWRRTIPENERNERLDQILEEYAKSEDIRPTIPEEIAINKNYRDAHERITSNKYSAMRSKPNGKRVVFPSEFNVAEVDLKGTVLLDRESGQELAKDGIPLLDEEGNSLVPEDLTGTTLIRMSDSLILQEDGQNVVGEKYWYPKESKNETKDQSSDNVHYDENNTNVANEIEDEPQQDNSQKEDITWRPSDHPHVRDQSEDFYLSEYEKARKKLKGIRDQIKNSLKRGFFYASGNTTDNRGISQFSQDVSDLIHEFAGLYDKDPEEISRLLMSFVQRQAGICQDRKSRYFGKKEPLKLEDWFICQTIRDMINNQRETGYPLRYVPNREIGETGCFCVPFMTKEEFEFLSESPNSALHGKSYSESTSENTDTIVKTSVLEWKISYRNLNREINRTENYDQKVVVEDMAKSMAELCGWSSDYITDQLGLPSDEFLGVNDAMTQRQIYNEGITSDDLKEANEITNARLDKSFKKQEKQSNRRQNAGPVNMFLNTFVRVQRSINALRAGSAVGAVVEKFDNNIKHAVAHQVAQRMFVDKEFYVNDSLYEYMEDPRVKDLLAGYEAITGSLGQNACLVFSSRKIPPTNENIAKFAEEWLGEKRKTAKTDKEKEELKNTEKLADKLITLCRKGQKLSSMIYGAEWFMRGSNGRRFIENYLRRQDELKNEWKKRESQDWRDFGIEFDPESNPVNTYVTAEELEMSFRQDPARTLVEMMGSMSGQRAFNQMRQRVMTGNYALTEAIRDGLKDRGVTNFILSDVIEVMYPTYYMNAHLKWMPFLNTCQLIAYKARAKSTDQELDALEYSEMLMSKDFRDAIILDVVNIGSNLGKVAILTCLANMLGWKLPERKDNKYKWDEIIIGGVPMRMFWWLDDYFTWSAPFAMACLVASEKGRDAGVWTFLDGLGDTMYGLCLDDIAEFFLFFDEEYITNQRAVEMGLESAEDVSKPENMFDFWTTQLLCFGLDKIGKAITWPDLNDMLNNGIIPSTDNLEHTPYYIYDPDSDDPDRQVKVSYKEANLRKMGSKYFFIGAGLNMLYNGGPFGLFGNPEKRTTGYTKNEQPIKKKSDAINQWWMQTTQLDLKDGEKLPEYDNLKASNERLSEIFDLVDSAVNYFGDADTMAAHGVCLSYPVRYFYSNMLKDQKDQKWNWYYSLPRSEQTNELYNKCKEFANEVERKQKLIFSDSIPYSPIYYEAYKTDYQIIYKDSDGNELTEMEFIVKKAANILGAEDKPTKKIIPYGNQKTWFVPGVASCVVSDIFDHTTFDYQTPAGWVTDQTDWQVADGFYKNLEFTEGSPYAGQKVMDVMFGGTENRDGIVPSMGSRGYVAKKQKVDYSKIIKPGSEEAKKQNGTNDTTNTNSYANSFTLPNSNGYGYTTYPKTTVSEYRRIYNNSRSINSDRASTMNTPRPYRAQTTYLRPQFSTKGSREAYRRQDM